MSSLRKLERNVIKSECYKKDGNTKKFKNEWDTYREKNLQVVKFR
jgi:hypothetical protein